MISIVCLLDFQISYFIFSSLYAMILMTRTHLVFVLFLLLSYIVVFMFNYVVANISYTITSSHFILIHFTTSIMISEIK